MGNGVTQETFLKARFVIFGYQKYVKKGYIELTKKFTSRLLKSVVGRSISHYSNRSQYTVNSIKHFIKSIKHEKIPTGYQMISFDVKSLFTKYSLDKTIEIILQRIYNRNEIARQITKKVMKEFSFLCTKEVHLAYSNGIYQQNDDAVMRSLLGLVLAGIFMVELETSIIPYLGSSLLKWKRYVGDTFRYVKVGTVNDTVNKLNGFNQNIQFTYELEKNNKLAFLDVLLIRNKDTIETTVSRKQTNGDIYLNWKSFSPTSWERGTLKTIIRRAYSIFSTPDYLQEELDNYPKWVIKQLLEEVKYNITEPVMKYCKSMK